MNDNSIILIIIVCGIISFIIGLPTFLLGCNPSVSDKCVAYNVFTGTVYKAGVYQKTCSRCSSKDKDGKCKQTDYYTCWDAFVFAHHINSKNETTSNCKIQTADSYTSQYYAEKTTNKYDIGEKVNWFKNKGTTNCESKGSVVTKWYVGVVFLSFTGLMLLLFLLKLFGDFLINFIDGMSNYSSVNTYTYKETNNEKITEIHTSVITENMEEKI